MRCLRSGSTVWWRMAQLVELGLGRSAIGDWDSAAGYIVCIAGCTRCGYPTLTRNGQFMAAVLACGEKAALSHLSAAVLWGMLGDRGGTIHVTAEGAGDGRGWWCTRRALGDDEVGKRAGIAVTTPARTLIDLADVAPRRILERAIDEAEYLRLDCTGLTPRHGRSGSGRLSSVLAVHAAGSSRTRSELEEMFLALCDQHQIPRPEVNVHVEGYECDFVWREQRLIVETDGGGRSRNQGGDEAGSGAGTRI